MFSLMSMIIVAALAGVAIRWSAGSTWLALLAVNSAGSLIAGVVAGLNRPESPWTQAVLIGFCGALTTFSGFAVVSVRLLEQGEFFKLAANIFLNNASCLLLCYAGWLIAHRVG